MTFGTAGLTLSALLALAAPAPAQDKPAVGRDTIIPGSGPNSSTTGAGGGGLMLAADAEDAAARRGLKDTLATAATFRPEDVLPAP